MIVARTRLGTINHSLLTIEALRGRGVPILGIAFVGPAEEDSEATIAALNNTLDFIREQDHREHRVVAHRPSLSVTSLSA